MGEIPRKPADPIPRADLLQPEQRIASFIARIDAGLFRIKGLAGQKGLGKRSGYCSLTTGLVAEIARSEGATAVNYQLQDIHRALGNQDPEETVLQHAATIVSFGTDPRKFLVDMSFMQYMQPDGRIMEGTVDMGLRTDLPLAQHLLNEQFVELTDETFRQYLALTSVSRNASYMQTASTNILNSVRPVEEFDPHDPILLEYL